MYCLNNQLHLLSGVSVKLYFHFLICKALYWDHGKYRLEKFHIILKKIQHSGLKVYKPKFQSPSRFSMLLNHQEMPQPLWISGSQWVVVVQSLSHVWLFMTPWTVVHQASLSFTISQSFSNSCPLNLWCHSIISFSVVPFSFFQSFPTSESFPVSLFFVSGGHGAPASISILPMNTQSWFPLGLNGLLPKGLSRVFSSTTVWKLWFFSTQPSLEMMLLGGGPKMAEE